MHRNNNQFPQKEQERSMGRYARICHPGLTYHVINRGNNREVILDHLTLLYKKNVVLSTLIAL